jgi:ribose 5-phosphate isomerase B
MIISIGADHSGFELKEKLKVYLKEIKQIGTIDSGAFSDEPCDYPDIASIVCENLLEENTDFGILICGTGIGMSICANRNAGIRAALCTSVYMAKKSRQHNNANILILGSKITDFEESKLILDEFLANKFDGGRHSSRLKKIT